MKNIDALLPLIAKPSRYIDHEINAVRKSFAEHPVRILFAFPDLYELGISHLGLKILYSIINALPYALADRVYLPWIDFLKLLKEHNLPLFGLESRKAAREFDLIGITLQSELTFSNVLELIHASQISVFAYKRSDADPIIMAGGPCASNPMPLAPFIDVFFIGEAESGIVEIAEILRDIPSRSERLKALSRLESCWVPQYDEDGNIIIPKSKIRSRKYSEFHKSENTHSPQLLSWQLATHNRYVAEIMRGCSRGCRFCHAGYFYRPVRERDASQILQELLSEVQKTGWDEAGLVSLSSSDYTCIRELMQALLAKVDTNKTHISLPSLRVDSLDSALVSLMQNLGREGLTIAPEAGTQRLRDIINKNLSEAEILRGVEIAVENSWQKIKLYFMIGLPLETDDDIEGIIRLVHKINEMGSKRLQINVSLSPFTPKPFTPFQWCAMLDKDCLLTRALRVKDAFRRNKNIRVRYHQIEHSMLDALLTRGDLDLARVLHLAWQKGARFDAWDECWDFSHWEAAFSELGIPMSRYLDKKNPEADLPWDFIDIGVDKEFLIQEYNKAMAGELSPDCRELCGFCGACTGDVQTVNALPTSDLDDIPALVSEKKSYNLHEQYRYRVSYKKLGLLRFISHLDWMRMLFRRIAMLPLPTVFTRGFSPHPKVSLSPPLPVGVESLSEYFDISFFEKLKPQEILAAFDRLQIPDFEVFDCVPFHEKQAPPQYEELQLHLFDDLLPAVENAVAAFAALDSLPFTKVTPKRSKDYELKDIVLDLSIKDGILFIGKKLESPSLYEVLEAILKIPKEELYQMRLVRSELRSAQIEN